MFLRSSHDSVCPWSCFDVSALRLCRCKISTIVCVCDAFHLSVQGMHNVDGLFVSIVPTGCFILHQMARVVAVVSVAALRCGKCV